MADEFTLKIMAPLVAGVIIGLYEILLIHRDVRVATHRFGHGVHAMLIALAATFAVFNVPLVFKLIPQLNTVPLIKNMLVFRIAIGLIMVIKIHGTSAAIKAQGVSSQGMSETWAHSLLIGALVIASPYIWPLIAPMLPEWMR